MFVDVARAPSPQRQRRRRAFYATKDENHVRTRNKTSETIPKRARFHFPAVFFNRAPAKDRPISSDQTRFVTRARVRTVLLRAKKSVRKQKIHNGNNFGKY